VTPDDLTLRHAEPAEADTVADLYGAARRAAVPQMPPARHTDVENRAWFAQRLAGDTHEVWVAEREGELVGYAMLTSAWLEHLFVRPGATGRGVGSLLLDLVKSLRPDGFSLWVFESNVAAQRFYRRHGLVALERTDGRANEERSPDIRMAWPGADPLRFFRRQIDEVDEQLGDLLARRVALTRAAQGHKSDARRDPRREREIAGSMAARVPALGPDRLARIVDAIITESLEATSEADPPNG
jgi:chorismate mutase/GNAT superfamily N-acetyltransferase